MRLFQPVGGFPDKHLIGIDENGHSHTVKADGASAPAETVESPTNRALPTWTMTEMENLVRGGKWEEVQGAPQGQPQQGDPRQGDSAAQPPAPTPQPADVANRPAESQPQAAQGDAKPTDDQASGKVRPFSDTK